MMVTDYLSFARTYVPLGVLRYNQHVFFVGTEKDCYGVSVDKCSQDVVDLYFSTSSNRIRFYRDSIEKEIVSSEYIHQVDTIGGKRHADEIERGVNKKQRRDLEGLDDAPENVGRVVGKHRQKKPSVPALSLQGKAGAVEKDLLVLNQQH